MIRPTRSVATAAVAVLSVVALAACGSDDEATVDPPAATTTDATDTPEETTTEEPEETTTDEPEETTSEEPEETAADPGGAPELTEIWPNTWDQASQATAIDADWVGTTQGMEMDIRIRGQVDDSNFEVSGLIDGAEVALIFVDGVAYIQGDEAFWEMSGAPDPSVLDGIWIEAPPELGVQDDLSLGALWGDFTRMVPSDANSLPVEESSVTEVDGVEAYHYVAAGSDEVEMWIRASDEKLLQIEAVMGSENYTMTFNGWDDEVELLEAPSDSVPIEELLG